MSSIAILPASAVDVDGTLAANSDLKVPSQKAVKTYTAGLLSGAHALVFKGVIDASANPNYPAADAGHVYRVSVAGRLGGGAGAVVEVGDTAYCVVDASAAGTQAAVGANWVIVQVNIDGAVVGPATAVSADFATFSGTTGKLVADSGLSLDTDGTLTANSDLKIPSQKAVKTYVAANAGAGASGLKRARSGYWYSNDIPGNVNNKALVQNTQYFVPVLLNKAISVDQMGTKVAILAASAVLRLGMYADNGSGVPSTLLGELSATLDASVTGTPSGSFATPLALAIGLYWLSIVAQGGAPSIVGAGTNVGAPGVGGATVGNVASGFNGSYAQGSITGALATAGTTTDNSVLPLIGFHVV